ncbi:hypothetical protein ACQZ4Y_25695 [Rhizobium sp. L80/93]|uniref:hypothetical protein n=1 Tax=Rhizobium sp. B230/85 TaxID=2819994 RepID=UPI001C5AE9D1|nr:hypothetical protein [Rhizobium sp. B230/85]QXZ98715.1 hypothetical protein J5289_19405 [Rhizobium sp. B230/85]
MISVWPNTGVPSGVIGRWPQQKVTSDIAAGKKAGDRGFECGRASFDKIRGVAGDFGHASEPDLIANLAGCGKRPLL